MPDKTETQTSMGPCGDIIVHDQPAGKTDAGFEDEKVLKFGLPANNSFDGLRIAPPSQNSFDKIKRLIFTSEHNSSGSGSGNALQASGNWGATVRGSKSSLTEKLSS